MCCWLDRKAVEVFFRVAVFIKVVAPRARPRASSSIAGDDSTPANSSIAGDDTSSSSSCPSSPGPSIAGDEPPAGGAGAGGLVDAPDIWPETLLGQQVQRVAGRRDSTWSYHRRLRVTCCNPKHEGCSKSRSTQLDVPAFGPQGVIFYLGAWLSASSKPEAEHRGYRPSPAEIRDFAATFGQGA